MSSVLMTADVLEIFSAEVARHGGRTTDVFHDGQRLFARGTLPTVRDVRTGDGVQGGVAIRAAGGAASVHPYTYRLVCKNGAIAARSVASRQMNLGYDWGDADGVADDLRDAVGASCDPAVLATSVDAIRATTDASVDMALTVLPMLAGLRGIVGDRLVQQVMDRLFDDGGRTMFGVMNAVTSVARDTADPRAKWNLEEFGGGIAVCRPAPRPTVPARRAVRRVAELVS
jgi:hypothetical protein